MILKSTKEYDAKNAHLSIQRYIASCKLHHIPYAVYQGCATMQYCRVKCT